MPADPSQVESDLKNTVGAAIMAFTAALNLIKQLKQSTIDPAGVSAATATLKTAINSFMGELQPTMDELNFEIPVLTDPVVSTNTTE